MRSSPGLRIRNPLTSAFRSFTGFAGKPEKSIKVKVWAPPGFAFKAGNAAEGESFGSRVLTGSEALVSIQEPSAFCERHPTTSTSEKSGTAAGPFFPSTRIDGTASAVSSSAPEVKSVLLQHIGNDGEVIGLAQAVRRVRRHRLAQGFVEAAQAVFAPVPHEAAADQGAALPAQIIAVTAAALCRINALAACRLGISVDTHPNAFELRRRGCGGQGEQAENRQQLQGQTSLLKLEHRADIYSLLRCRTKWRAIPARFPGHFDNCVFPVDGSHCSGGSWRHHLGPRQKRYGSV